tara:strand:- start:7184 stop:8686 length:1503 start_codon:yes stop_codon:yes gene_type:complete
MASKLIKISQACLYKNCVLCYGHFNTIHPGHIRYLKHAKLHGKKLVVALKGDGLESSKPRFQFNQAERAEALSLLDIADAVLLLSENELGSAIKEIIPSRLVLGKHLETSPDVEVSEAINILNGLGVPILFHGGDTQYATTELLTSSENDLRIKRRSEFQQACNRQSLDSQVLVNSMNKWNTTNLIIVGDTIVDQYVACEALGMSAEAPVVVVRELKDKNFIGGAAIVSSHVKRLGAKCKLISVVGNDSNGLFVRKQLEKEGISDGLIIDPSRPTTFKKRYIVENQKLFRVTRLEQSELGKEIENKVIDELEKSAAVANGIVISDFVYGVITERILKKIHQLAEKFNLLLFGDLQCSSQIGSITKFNDFSLLCPNEREARIALHDKDLGLESLSHAIIKKTRAKSLIMKLGVEGFIAYDCKGEDQISTQAFPALSVNPVDVAGAGDSLLAVMAVGLSSSQPMMTTAAIACCMASIAVEKMGNKPISSDEIKINILENLDV